MKKLKLIMSDDNFTNAIVYDEEGNELGCITEVSKRAKREVLFIQVGENVSPETMETVRKIMLETLSEGGNPFMVFANQVKVAKVKLDDHQVKTAKIFTQRDGKVLSEDELIIEDIIK